MRREIVDLIIGLVLIIVGIVIMLFVFSTALNLAFSSGDFFREQLPGEEAVSGPRAEFSWDTDDLNVTFEDQSSEGDGNIVSWEWDFGDGNQDNDQNPSHPYNNEGNYQVTLRIEDDNGKRNSATGEVILEAGGARSGSSIGGIPEISFDVDFTNMLLPIAIALLVGTLFLVMFLVGAAITKAGWNILKPKPEKLKIKLKPKEIQIQQVGTYAAAPQQPVQPQYQQPVQQPAEQYSPPPPGEYEE
ncbi:MAG: PKD domain-containing protein [Thermoplasmata archaeon]|nr:PKD domain-containing protein [Thermoplasmata archaeon]